MQRNGYKVPQDATKGPFADAWSGKSTWDLYEAEPERGTVFNSYMATWQKTSKPWADIYPAKARLCDCIDQGEDAVLIVDLGGGSGNMLKAFAKDIEYRSGALIVQDLKAALKDVHSLQQKGIVAMIYDFFSPQPIQGSHILEAQVKAKGPSQVPKPIISVPSSMTGLIMHFAKS